MQRHGLDACASFVCAAPVSACRRWHPNCNPNEQRGHSWASLLICFLTEVFTMFKKTFGALFLGLALTAGCDSLGLGGNNDSSNSDKTTHRDDRISRDRGTARTRDRGGVWS